MSGAAIAAAAARLATGAWNAGALNAAVAEKSDSDLHAKRTSCEVSSRALGASCSGRAHRRHTLLSELRREIAFIYFGFGAVLESWKL
jgi:hypothetical protein